MNRINEISEKLISFDETIGDYDSLVDNRSILNEYESFLRKNMEEITNICINYKSFFDKHKSIIYNGYKYVAPWTVICIDIAKNVDDIKSYFDDSVLLYHGYYLLVANFYNEFCRQDVIKIMRNLDDANYEGIFNDLVNRADTSYDFLKNIDKEDYTRFLSIIKGINSDPINYIDSVNKDIKSSLDFSIFCKVNRLKNREDRFMLDFKAIKQDINNERSKIIRKIDGATKKVKSSILQNE